MRKVCWMFVNPGVTEGVKRQEMIHGQGMMITLGVDSYERGVEEAKKLVEEGIVLLELCAHFFCQKKNGGQMIRPDSFQ